ncbi:YcnI family protein [Microbacterium aoyamense]|nr:YcnI family protein [Microbacterium aoyamense]
MKKKIIITGIAAGALLAVAVPLAASAHVHVNPEEVSAGATEALTFSFSHGCDDSPTTALTVTIPEGVGNATPVVQGGWTISRELGADGVPTSVTYTADAPIESGLKATVSMDVLIDTSAANSTLAFPVVQECVTGATEWTEVAADGVDPETLDAPAPLVTVGDAVAEGEEHGGHGEESAATEAEASPAGVDPVARWIAGGALVAGIAALVVAVVRRRA